MGQLAGEPGLGAARLDAGYGGLLWRYWCQGFTQLLDIQQICWKVVTPRAVNLWSQIKTERMRNVQVFERQSFLAGRSKVQAHQVKTFL